jgi:rubrerythrin
MPPAIFRAAEILDMAIQIENQGIAFYSACMEMVDSSELKEVFTFLIGQERNHRDIFSGMKTAFIDVSLPESFAGEYESNVAAFVRGKIFASPEVGAEKARSLPDALAAVDWALEFEQGSIDFYKLIKNNVRASEGADIERIIGEEKRHIDILQGLRRKLNTGS